MTQHPRLADATQLLRRLIATPSPSNEEAATADILFDWLAERGAAPERFHNNVIAVAPGFDPALPVLMLNSHHDTVKPSPSYTRNPYEPVLEDDRLYGLGSNDAGASLVSLACTFVDYIANPPASPRFNLVLALSATEERMGPEGMSALLPHLEERGMKPDMVIVGEPTSMQPAIAERGLLVFDGETPGVSGHAARNEGVNAIYRAMEDIDALRRFSPERVSKVLGPIKVSVTGIQAGTQHNVVPDICRFVVDVRTTDAYTNPETVELLRAVVTHSRLTPRSTRVQASVIADDHPLVRSAVALGLTPFVSATTSDRALMHGIPALKIGPGESSRSHTADEFVLISELNSALLIYPQILNNLQ